MYDKFYVQSYICTAHFYPLFLCFYGFYTTIICSNKHFNTVLMYYFLFGTTYNKLNIYSDDLKIVNSRPSASNFQKFFLITRTIFSHSWSEQFSIHKELKLVGSNPKGGIISGFFSLWIKSKKSAKSHS